MVLIELGTRVRYSTSSNFEILNHLNLPRFLLICTSKWLNKYRRFEATLLHYNLRDLFINYLRKSKKIR